MTNSTAPIPPLVCSTPPPIDDFAKEDDDEAATTPNLEFDEFDRFGGDVVLPEQNADGEDTMFIHIPNQHNVKNTVQTELAYGSNIRYIANNSPPPLVLEPNNESKFRNDGLITAEAFNFYINADNKAASHPELAVSKLEHSDKKIKIVLQPQALIKGNSNDKDDNITESKCIITNNLSTLPTKQDYFAKLECNEKKVDIVSQSPDLIKDNCNDEDENIEESVCEIKVSVSTYPQTEEFVEDIKNKESEINENIAKLQINDKNWLQYQKESCGNMDTVTDIFSDQADVDNSFNKVTVEDICDDSSDDEIFVSKKSFSISENERTENFFAILPIASSATAQSNKQTNKSKENLSNNAQKFGQIPSMAPSKLIILNEKSQPLNESRYAKEDKPIATLIDEPSLFKNKNDSENFEEFQAYKGPLPTNILNSNPILTSIESSYSGNCNKRITYDEEEFNDFTNATSAPEYSRRKTTATTEPISNSSKRNIQTLSKTNIVDLMVPVLKMMFPVEEEISNRIISDRNTQYKFNKSKSIHLHTIETANALKYQWLNSDMRHALIKSLGIDSRNILFGENWNSSMPRFAANLSLNPLKPIKPEQPVAVNIPENCFVLANTPHLIVAAVDTISSTTTITDPTNEGSNCDSKLTTYEVHTNHVLVTTDAKTNNINDIVNTNGSLSMIDISSTKQVDDSEEFTPNISAPKSNVDYEDSTNNNTVTSDLTAGNKTIPISLKAMSHSPQLGINENEVVTKSTFSGPLKETHIFTPGTKTDPVDFDYEIAAAGIIINETVVKQEYRDIEYNPGFGLAFIKSNDDEYKSEQQETLNDNHDYEFEDEFTDFQSMPAATVNSTTPNIKEMESSTNTSPGEMILSPAVLLPQTILLDGKNNKIEWGEAAANINPDELARIEELYPQQKSFRSKDSNSSLKSSPINNCKENQHNSLSISASIAQKEKNNSNEDDDWTEFVSVLSPNPTSTSIMHQVSSNSNNYTQLHSELIQSMEKAAGCNKISDEEWSEFVSSKPMPNSVGNVPSYRSLPQFNSAAWQNANFYNNPLSFYHQSKINTVPKPLPTILEKNNNYHIKNTENYCMPNYKEQRESKTEFKNQQIHVMQDFSTTTQRPNSSFHKKKSTSTSQVQTGSAKVAPSISLIPDLGFVAPAIPTHTANGLVDKNWRHSQFTITTNMGLRVDKEVGSITGFFEVLLSGNYRKLRQTVLNISEVMITFKYLDKSTFFEVCIFIAPPMVSFSNEFPFLLTNSSKKSL